jgi:dephospho-CoA kinase
MKVIGITGGIGSGKSVVSKLLEVNGIPVYNTDIRGMILSNVSFDIREKLSERFGPEIYTEGGLLNRPLLAQKIFGDTEARDFVNAVIHPVVAEDFVEWKDEQSPAEWVGIESAILFESGFDRLTDSTVNISAPVEVRIRRVQQRDRLDREAVLRRIDSQWPDEEKCRRADFVLYNDDRQALIPQIEKLYFINKKLC